MTIDTTKAENETRKHIMRVNELLMVFVRELTWRGVEHDFTKFMPVEIMALAKMQELTDREGHVEFGTVEYEQRKALLEPMLDNHYRCNRHHPEYHGNGVNGMNLIDVLEMFVDWKAASERSGNKFDMKHAIAKYKIEPQLAQILQNTFDNFIYEVDV
jgi:hypothetical protein